MSFPGGLVSQVQRRGVPLDGQHAGAGGAMPGATAEGAEVQDVQGAGGCCTLEKVKVWIITSRTPYLGTAPSS